MNTGFYKDLDTNFELACEMSEKDFSHKELIEMLEFGNIPERQIAALRLYDVLNESEADILVDNLTGCDGKIREAVALRINRFIFEDIKYAKMFSQAEIFADASIDINANICRLVIDSVSALKQNEEFAKVYLKKILTFINEAFQELDSFIFRDKKYVINKQLFKLYWCLEALKLFAKDVDKVLLFSIIERSSKEREYTVREKAAEIIAKTDDSMFDELKKTLQNDENYYVRAVFT